MPELNSQGPQAQNKLARTLFILLYCTVTQASGLRICHRIKLTNQFPLLHIKRAVNCVFKFVLVLVLFLHDQINISLDQEHYLIIMSIQCLVLVTSLCRRHHHNHD